MMQKFTIAFVLLIAFCQVKAQNDYIISPWTNVIPGKQYYLSNTAVTTVLPTLQQEKLGPKELYNPYWPNSRRMARFAHKMAKVASRHRQEQPAETPYGGLHKYTPTYGYTGNSFPTPAYQPNYPRQHYGFKLDNQPLTKGGPQWEYDNYGNGFITGFKRARFHRKSRQYQPNYGFTSSTQGLNQWTGKPYEYAPTTPRTVNGFTITGGAQTGAIGPVFQADGWGQNHAYQSLQKPYTFGPVFRSDGRGVTHAYTSMRMSLAKKMHRHIQKALKRMN